MNKQLLPTELIQYILKIKTFTRNKRIQRIHLLLHLTLIPIEIEEISFGVDSRDVYFVRKRSLEIVFEELPFDETVLKVAMTSPPYRKMKMLYLPSIYIPILNYTRHNNKWVRTASLSTTQVY